MKFSLVIATACAVSLFVSFLELLCNYQEFLGKVEARLFSATTGFRVQKKVKTETPASAGVLLRTEWVR